MIDALLLADLTNDLTPAVRFQRLVYALKEIFNCGAVVLLKKEAEQLRPVALEGLVKEALGRRFKIAEHPRLATILSSREPIIFAPDNRVPDPYDGLLDALVGEPLPVHDCMGVSLYVEGVLWGALTLDSLVAGTFKAESALLLKRYALLVEIFVRVTQLEQERLGWRSLSLEARGVRAAPDRSEIIAKSEAITQLLHELKLVAQSDLPLLLLGETGVGKELFARFVHQHSQRSNKPMLHINCAALPESLAESELFGHVKGAFSGATQDRQGRFEAAHGGTLFLDEVGELPLSVQAKLLRVLQSGEIQRLGSDATRQVDVRIVAATNRHLQEGIKNGGFRADLYHRLSVYPVPIPPLRERPDDILLLAGHFLELNRSRLGLRCLRLSAAAEYALLNYAWPGNVRELEHVISRAALKTLARQATANDWVSLEPEELDLTHPSGPQALQMGSELTEASLLPLKQQVDLCQRQAIQQALERTEGNWSLAAKQLEVDSSNLHKLAKRLQLK
ncbi:MAG: nitric oxide reductase transcriptional regulator NorR [Pseudomonadaceae bacterium]|nr:nitric oxide reductase transcriptional regulator NorR [Pseudomonadaceae bacterium]